LAVKPLMLAVRGLLFRVRDHLGFALEISAMSPKCCVSQRCSWLGELFRLPLYLTPLSYLFTGVAPVAEFTWALLMSFWTRTRAAVQALIWGAGGKFVVTSKRGRQSRGLWSLVRPQLVLVTVLALGWGWGQFLLGLSSDWGGLVLPTPWALFYMALAFVVIRRSLAPDDSRYDYRHPVNLTLAYSVEGGKQQSATPRLGLTVDASEHGLGVLSYERLEPNTALEIELHGAGDPLPYRDRVAWAQELFSAEGVPLQGFRNGVALENLSPSQLARSIRSVAGSMAVAFGSAYLQYSRSPGMSISSTAMSTGTPLTGALGHFRIVERLGEGGMGTVYLAEHPKLGRLALKVPLLRGDNNVELLARFYREARLAQIVHHPFICPVYEFGEIEGTHYLTMPFVEGAPLSRLIQPGAPWEPGRAARLVCRLALALQALHERQVIHRDLKPHNVMVRANDDPMLMDFGLAVELGDDNTRLTGPGATLGTPAYMAPEQIEGEPQAFGPSTDVYGLGVILYQLLTGRLPFEGRNMAALVRKILDTDPARPTAWRPDLGSELEQVCLKMVAKRSEDRHPDMAAVVAELDACPEQRPPDPPRAVDAFAGGDPAQPLAVFSGSAVPDTKGSNLLPRAETASQRAPGEVLTVSIVPGVEMKFAWVPAGSFLRGSQRHEKGRESHETQHQVTLTKGFFLGVFPVTRTQWQALLLGLPPKTDGGDLPVVSVSWHDCQEFYEGMGDKLGKRFRLPTEAEWEYAARAGSITAFHFGETISTEQANYDGNRTDGEGRSGVQRNEPKPVGSFPPNSWGLHDMHGNVWEWCSDWYGPYPSGGVTDPPGAGTGYARVLRGGSWDSSQVACRSAHRFFRNPEVREIIIGCRLVLCPD
jgi:formylglycine-generating enzyme required for sulfatase activity/serine/threonine protein kinase